MILAAVLFFVYIFSLTFVTNYIQIIRRMKRKGLHCTYSFNLPSLIVLIISPVFSWVWMIKDTRLQVIEKIFLLAFQDNPLKLKEITELKKDIIKDYC